MSRRRYKILCVHCRAHLYNYSGAFPHGGTPNFRDFKPATSGIPAPGPGEAMICFRCGQAFYITNHRGSIYMLTNEGLKPREPVGAPKVFTPDPLGYVVPETPPEFHVSESTEYKDPKPGEP